MDDYERYCDYEALDGTWDDVTRAVFDVRKERLSEIVHQTNRLVDLLKARRQLTIADPNDPSFNYEDEDEAGETDADYIGAIHSIVEGKSS